MKKEQANKIINELDAIVMSHSQGVKMRSFELETAPGQLIARNFDFMHQIGINSSVVIKAVIAIVAVLSSSRRKWGKAFRIGRIILGAIIDVVSTRKMVAADLIVNRYFAAYEFFDARTIKMLRAKGIRPSGAVNPVILAIVTYIRKETGHAVIGNTWHHGGHISQRGYRGPWSKTGGRGSMHRKKIKIKNKTYLGEAQDITIFGLSQDEAMKFLSDHEVELFSLGLRRVEMPQYTQSSLGYWIHLDTKPTNKNEIYYFKP